MEKRYVSKNERRHMGGWSSYCSFYEIFDDKGKLVAQVNEEDAQLFYLIKKVLIIKFLVVNIKVKQFLLHC